MLNSRRIEIYLYHTRHGHLIVHIEDSPGLIIFNTKFSALAQSAHDSSPADTGWLRATTGQPAITSTVFVYLPLIQRSEIIRFAVIGDYGLASQGEQEVANLVKSWAPSFIVTTGDNNYPSGAASTIDENTGQYYHDFTQAITEQAQPSIGFSRRWAITIG